METIKKVLHPKESASHQTHNTNEPTTTAHHHDHTSSSPSGIPPDARPDQQTLDRLGNEPNVTGTSRPPPHEDFPAAHHNTAAATTTTAGDEPKINRGHHHPRQPVGATGTPAGHGGGAAAGVGAAGAGAGTHDIKSQAEAGNNFPGTNPNPSHSA